ncbi:MAG TPA: DUF1761 domain-containing protein [Saprospiraceae bacterium]|nr:DUF1761 domain-containing protein [Saprospiraceae bacterium]
MPTNYYLFFVTALIPLLMGFIYYHPKVLGNVWMKTNNFNEETMKGANMALIFGLTYVFGIIISLMMTSIIIHQSHIASILVPEVSDKTSAAYQDMVEFMGKYGMRYRTASHGMVHGGVIALLFVTPIIAINSLFERRGWKYVLIHAGYWFLTLVAMGAILCPALNYEM